MKKYIMILFGFLLMMLFFYFINSRKVNEDFKKYKKLKKVNEISNDYAQNLSEDSEKYNLYQNTVKNNSAPKLASDAKRIKCYIRLAEEYIDYKGNDCKNHDNLIASIYEPEEEWGDLGNFPRLLIMVDRVQEKVCFSTLVKKEPYYKFCGSEDLLK